MICVERVHRFMMTFMLILCVVLMQSGYILASSAVLCFMAVMMTSWAVFNFCPAITILKKIIPTCKFGANNA